jgi:hypothetical protein
MLKGEAVYAPEQMPWRLAILLSLIQEKPMQDIRKLEVGMTTKIGTDQVKEPEVGREYVRGRQEKPMQDIRKLEVGMTTKIGTDQVKEPEVGRFQ